MGHLSAWEKSRVHQHTTTPTALPPSGPAGGVLSGAYPNPAFATGALDLLTLQGADIASASTTNIAAATGRNVNITGTTTITALGTANAGVERVTRFTGALVLTYNATSLINITAANITTAANDVAVWLSLGSGNWRMTEYTRASGAALVGSGTSGGTSADWLSATFCGGLM